MPETSYRRNGAPQDGISASRPVGGSEWTAAARLQNHVASRGRVLVPTMRPEPVTLTKTVYEYAFWMVPTYNALVRRWRVSATCDGPLELSVNGGTSVRDPELGSAASRNTARLPARALRFDEVLVSQTATESGAILELDCDGDTLVVDSIECFELPRAFIDADSNELGVELAPFRSSQPIRADVFANLYAGAMNADVGRRVFFQWAVPYSAAGSATTDFAASTTSATFGDLFAVAKLCLARKLYNDGAAYTFCNGRVFAWVSPGGGGEVRFTTAAGTSAVVAISNTSPEWSDAVTDVRVLHEDIGADDGVPGAGIDEVQVELRATSGTLYIASAIAYE